MRICLSKFVFLLFNSADMRKIGFIALLFMAGLWSCEYETIRPIVVEVPDGVEYATQVAPIFVDAGCASCHSGGIKPDMRADKSWDALVNDGMVDTENPAESILMVKINSGHATSGNLSAEDKAYILKWIAEGAKNN